MPTILSHPAVPLALRAAAGPHAVSGRLLGAAIAASILPDFDSVGFWLGVPYAHPLGHRGLSHALAFAALLGGLAALAARRLDARPAIAFLVVAVAGASHGLLDAATDGGLGIALLAPFSNERFFLPWRPLAVSPIGVDGLLGARGLRVFASELLWVWLPLGVAAAVAARTRRLGALAGGVR